MSANRLNESALTPAGSFLLQGWVLSLLVHGVVAGGLVLAQQLGWLHKSPVAWLQPALTPAEALAKKKAEELHPAAPEETPLLFVEVDPSLAAPEPPKNSKYYSSHNSQAANPDITIDTTTPKIDGKQVHVAKTETAPRAKSTPKTAPALQPSPEKNPQPQPPQASAPPPKPKGGPKIGDLAMAKPADRPGDGQADSPKGEAPVEEHHRPRTLAEAAMQRALTGEKMKQEGGVKRRLSISTLDAKATPFGEYDREVVQAIQLRWYDLLDRETFSRDRSGKVVISFRLNYDGRVTNLRIVESTVGDLLSYVCSAAIHDPAPFAPWPGDMRRIIGEDYREVTFTFYYE